jgi:hypothetical protein
MSAYTNEYAQKIYDILAPMVGDLMSKSIIKSNTAKLGIKEDSIQLSNLPILAAEMKKGLVVFLGTGAAETVALRIANIH